MVSAEYLPRCRLVDYRNRNTSFEFSFVRSAVDEVEIEELSECGICQFHVRCERGLPI